MLRDFGVVTSCGADNLHVAVASYVSLFPQTTAQT